LSQARVTRPSHDGRGRWNSWEGFHGEELISLGAKDLEGLLPADHLAAVRACGIRQNMATAILPRLYPQTENDHV
jgi:hypothetical protein